MEKKTIIYLLMLILVSTSCLFRNKNSKYKKENYVLVWSDEFEKDGLPDSTKWSYDVSGNEWGWGNNEKQSYTFKRLDNAHVKNGQLYITAKRENINGREYSSARLVTKGKGDWKYGLIEVKAIIPGGRGIWPAIWMMPTNSAYGIWPESGEIDLMENVGFKPDSIFSAIHTKTYNHKDYTQKAASVSVPDCHSKYHVYKLKWTEDKIETFVDNEKFFEFQNEKNTFKEWPFDNPFYLIMNVAVGGDWGGQHGIDNSVFPQSMVVDYVRVYQRK